MVGVNKVGHTFGPVLTYTELTGTIHFCFRWIIIVKSILYQEKFMKRKLLLNVIVASIGILISLIVIEIVLRAQNFFAIGWFSQ